MILLIAGILVAGLGCVFMIGTVWYAITNRELTEGTRVEVWGGLLFQLVRYAVAIAIGAYMIKVGLD